MPQQLRQPLSALIKPTSSRCNLDCAYCFYLEKQALYPWKDHPTLSLDTFEVFLRQYAEVSAPSFSLAWQGGEPTLMGLEFFERAVALEAKVAKETSGGRQATVMNALQTNGVLVDEDWARFLRDWRFLVGVSIDGPAEVHDRYRRDRAGSPTHDRVMAGIESLRRFGVEFNVLVVVSQANVHAPRETFRWLVGQGFDNLQFIPCVEPAAGASVRAGGLTPESITPAEYGSFMNGVFDAWLEAGFRKVRVRSLDNLAQMLLGMPSESCQLAESCGYVLLEHNGDIYPCDFFVEGDWLLGNVHETTVAAMLAGERFAAFHRLKGSQHAECRGCRWRPLCQGECPRYRITATGRSARRADLLLRVVQGVLREELSTAGEGGSHGGARAWARRAIRRAGAVGAGEDASGSAGRSPARGLTSGEKRPLPLWQRAEAEALLRSLALRLEVRDGLDLEGVGHHLH